MAAGSTYTPINTTTAAGGETSITFSSIPSTYTDLVLVIAAKNSSGAFYDNLLRFNNDSGSNYSNTKLYGDGSTINSNRGSNLTSMQVGWGGANPTTNIVQIQNYSNTTTYKSVLSRSGDGSSNVGAWAGLWRSTSAINRVDILAYSGTNFLAGSTFTLYGIQAA